MLEEYTITELEEEIKRRNKKKEKKPEPVENPDFSQLITECKSIIDEIEDEGYKNEEDEHYVYESAMTAVFGENVFDWINEQMK